MPECNQRRANCTGLRAELVKTFNFISTNFILNPSIIDISFTIKSIYSGKVETILRNSDPSQKSIIVAYMKISTPVEMVEPVINSFNIVVDNPNNIVYSLYYLNYKPAVDVNGNRIFFSTILNNFELLPGEYIIK